jgi:hypothetical protein
VPPRNGLVHYSESALLGESSYVRDVKPGNDPVTIFTAKMTFSDLPQTSSLDFGLSSRLKSDLSRLCLFSTHSA